MKSHACYILASLIELIAFTGGFSESTSRVAATNYLVQGVVKEIKPIERQLVIAHEAISNFMEAMTMPFNVKDATILTNVVAGQKISFQLHVTDTESWIDGIER